MSDARQRRLASLASPDRAATVRPPAAPAAPLGQPPRPPTPTVDLTPDLGGRTAPRRTTRSAGGGKHRRAVTVPTGLVEQLRRRARQLDRYQTDLILDCLTATATELEHAHTQATVTDSSPFARPRRHAQRGRTVTTLTLYLTRAEVDAMDALATRLGLSRSGLVTRALEHGLEHTT